MNLLADGLKVAIKDSNLQGIIAGVAFGRLAGPRKSDVYYLVDLGVYGGFYSQDKQQFVSVLVVHPDNIILLEDLNTLSRQGGN